MRLRTVSSRFAVFGIALLLQSTAFAQFPNREAMMKPQPIKTGGKLVSTAQNQLQLSTNMNQTIYVMLRPETEVSVTGSADKDYLKSGVTVEFVAEVAKGHNVQEKVLHLTVISPTTELGLFPSDVAVGEKPEKKAKGEKGKKAEANPLEADAGGDAAPAPARKSGGKKSADPFGDAMGGKSSKHTSGALQFPGTYTVRGTIKSFKNGKVAVAAGRGPTVKAEIADDAVIDVEMADYRVARPDDKVKLEGFTTQARPNLVVAKSIEIELANPLSGAKKHTTRTSKASAAKPKKSASAGDDLLGSGK